MRIKTLALAMAVSGSAIATAGEVKTVADIQPLTTVIKIRCIDGAGVMPMPTEAQPKVCQNHLKDSNYKVKTLLEAEKVKTAVTQPVKTDPMVKPVLPKNGAIITPVPEFKVMPTNTSIPAVDATQKQYDVFFENASNHLRAVYIPARFGQYSLPNDIADIKVGRVKTGLSSNFDLFGEKDKLSIYLFQHKPAMRFYGLYKQRIIAWHNGQAPSDVNVERAINREMRHNFLETVLVSNATTDDMVKYFDGRLSSKDSDILRAWLTKYKDESKTSTVIDIIANGIAQQKTDSLFLR